MRHVTITVALLCAALSLSGAAARSQAGEDIPRKHALRIAVVDIDRALNEYQKSRDLAKRIADKYQPKVDDLTKKARFIREQQRRLAASPHKKDSPEYLREKHKIKAQAAELEMEEKIYVTERNDEEIEAMIQVWEDFLAGIAKHAKDNGLDLVLKKQKTDMRANPPRLKETFMHKVSIHALLYCAEGVDVTDQLVKQMNNDYERGKTAPKG